MGNIHEILDRSEMMIHKGIDELNQQGELNASTLEMLGDALDALKDIEEIRGMAMGGSFERYGERSRDSMGRFTEYGRRYNEGGYGERYGYRDGGYRDGRYGERRYGEDSRERRARIEMQMRNAQTEQERDMYRRMLDEM